MMAAHPGSLNKLIVQKVGVRDWMATSDRQRQVAGWCYANISRIVLSLCFLSWGLEW